MRGRKPLPDICRVCGAEIVRIVISGTLRRDRLCNLCATEKVMQRKWGGKSQDEISERLKRAERTVKTLRKVLKERGRDEKS
jgi:hypothetical protein